MTRPDRLRDAALYGDWWVARHVLSALTNEYSTWQEVVCGWEMTTSNSPKERAHARTFLLLVAEAME